MLDRTDLWLYGLERILFVAYEYVAFWVLYPQVDFLDGSSTLYMDSWVICTLEYAAEILLRRIEHI